MTSHLDADGLASYQAGLVTGRPGRVITTHLAGCTECATLAEQLAEVSVLLAAAPMPPVPDALLQRLDLALATEYEERPVVPVSKARRPWLKAAPWRGSGSRAGAGSRSGSGSRPVPWRVLAPAAAVLVLGAGGYGLSQLGSGPSPTAASSGTAAGAMRAGGAEAVPAASSASAPRGELGPREQVVAPDEPGGKLSVVYSQIDYQPANLASELSAQVRAGLTGVRPVTTIAACVLRIADGAHPTLVEVARYRGSPVTVVVVPSASGHGYLARLAGPGCSAANSDIVAEAELPAGISAP
jgi:hypothetical protein